MVLIVVFFLLKKCSVYFVDVRRVSLKCLGFRLALVVSEVYGVFVFGDRGEAHEV